jgi:hypothetical protein
VIGQPLIRAARAHAAHMFCATACGAEDHRFKELAERLSEGRESASFADSWLSHLNAGVANFSNARIRADAAQASM